MLTRRSLRHGTFLRLLPAPIHIHLVPNTWPLEYPVGDKLSTTRLHALRAAGNRSCRLFAIHRQERPRVPVPVRRHHVTASEMPVKLCLANIQNNSRLQRPTLHALSAI